MAFFIALLQREVFQRVKNALKKSFKDWTIVLSVHQVEPSMTQEPSMTNGLELIANNDSLTPIIALD